MWLGLCHQTNPNIYACSFVIVVRCCIHSFNHHSVSQWSQFIDHLSSSSFHSFGFVFRFDCASSADGGVYFKQYFLIIIYHFPYGCTCSSLSSETPWHKYSAVSVGNWNSAIKQKKKRRAGDQRAACESVVRPSCRVRVLEIRHRIHRSISLQSANSHALLAAKPLLLDWAAAVWLARTLAGETRRQT